MLNSQSVIIILIGSLTVIGSFLGGMRMRFGMWCIIDPDLIRGLQGKSFPIRAIVVVIILFNLVSVIVGFSTSVIDFTGQLKIRFYFYLILWGCINFLLWFLYRIFKASDSGESQGKQEIQALPLKAIYTAGGLAILGIYAYTHSSSGMDNNGALPGLIAIILIIYGLYVVTNRSTYGTWMVLSPGHRSILDDIWIVFGGLRMESYRYCDILIDVAASDHRGSRKMVRDLHYSVLFLRESTISSLDRSDKYSGLPGTGVISD